MKTENNLSTKKLSFKEDFAKFFESPDRVLLKTILENHLGEFSYLDFKYNWQTCSKMARHILALANSGGGCIIIGVSEKKDKTLEVTGIEKLKDKAEFTRNTYKFLPDNLKPNIECLDFVYQDSEYSKIIGKKFQVIFVQTDHKYLPFVSMKDGDDDIKENKIYIRQGTESKEANYEELQNIINKRLETSYSSRNEIDLRTHIQEIKMLYELLEPTYTKSILLEEIKKTLMLNNLTKTTKNSNYPNENYEKFIARMIEKKKKRIEIVLDVVDL